MDCYDSDGNGLPCVDESEFKNFKMSLNKDLGPENIAVLGSSKFASWSNEAIDWIKVDEPPVMSKKYLLGQSDLTKDVNGVY